MTENITPPRAKGRTLTPYVALWALLAGLALTYLALLATRPELLSSQLGNAPTRSGAETHESQRAMSDTLAEVRSLRDSLGQVHNDLLDLKSEVAARAERESELNLRIAALENSPRTVAEVTPRPAATTPQPVAAKSAERLPAKSGAKPTPEQKTATPPAPVALAPPAAKAAAKVPAKSPIPAPPVPVANPGPNPALETGSVKGAGATPFEFGPAVVTSSAKPVGLQLATGPSVDSLRLSWGLLAERHADSLKSLQPRYISGVDASGLTYDLVVGPVGSSVEAKRICKELTLKGTVCKVAEFTGDAL
jgi:hypothetical protein